MQFGVTALNSPLPFMGPSETLLILHLQTVKKNITHLLLEALEIENVTSFPQVLEDLQSKLQTEMQMKVFNFKFICYY